MPSEALRNGIFPQVIADPTTGLPFPDNAIPDYRIARQAKALLGLYPGANSPLANGYNYQIGAKGVTNSDEVQGRANKTINMKNFVVAQFSWRRSDSTAPSIFGFIDNTHMNGINATGSWTHRFGTRLQMGISYNYSRSASLMTPYFAFRQNVSGEAGIAGNNQEPGNWGPPALSFSSGIHGLSDAQQSFTRNSTSGVSVNGTWMRSPHNISFTADFRRQQFNLLSQQDARGTLTFTGAATQNSASASPAVATGSDFADFLLGIPDTVSIAYGNADKYLRANMWSAGVTDDWRVLPGFTLNAGVRWEYNSPISEHYGRLVNLDVAPGFAAVQPVLGYSPVGGLSGQRYPQSLVRPDKYSFQPRVAFAWHPFVGASTVVRGGYGVYYNTSVYQSLAMQMAQQSPLSKSLSVANSATPAAHLGQSVPGHAYRHSQYFCARSGLPGGLRAELAVLGTARRDGLDCHDRHVPGHQGHAGHPGLPAEHVPRRRREPLPRLPFGLLVHHLERQLHPRSRHAAAAAAPAQRNRSQHAVHVFARLR